MAAKTPGAGLRGSDGDLSGASSGQSPVLTPWSLERRVESTIPEIADAIAKRLKQAGAW